MPLQTFVSFDANFSADSQPPGRALADYVSTVLADARLSHEKPVEREGWAWTIRLGHAFTQVEIVVGQMRGHPNGWLITMDGHFSLARGIAIGGDADEERDKALRPICLALDRALNHDPRFTDIRWYTPEEFDSSHGK
jgi:hypothetical protein